MIGRARRVATGKSLVMSAAFSLLVALFGPSPASCTVAEQRMEIQDTSDKGSPIQISGYMTLRYDSENRFPFSYEESTSVKNVSSKGILLMIVRLEATSGPGSDEKYSQEYFFGDALAPGQVELNHNLEQRFGASVVNGEPLPYEKDPHPAAQAHAEFVQFSDGSTWGDVESATGVLALRRKALEELDLLEHLYEQAGESAFLEEFAQADDFLGIIRQMKDRCGEKTADSKCAHSIVHRTFLTAKEHKVAISLHAPVEQQ